jgi:acylphosphatase
MPSQPENYFQFEKLLVELARAGVDFAVVGGVAVSLNGFVRATDDVDIIVSTPRDNIERMLACLRNWGEGWAREFQPEEFAPKEGSLRLMEEFDLDIFTQMRGKSLDDFRPTLRFLETSGARIPYIAPEDLLFLKQGSWREKDQIDAAAMREIIERERRTKG